MVESVPGIEPVLKVLLQEDGNALESASKSISNATQKVSDVTQKVSDVTSSVTGYFSGSKLDEKPPATQVKSMFRQSISVHFTFIFY